MKVKFKVPSYEDISITIYYLVKDKKFVEELALEREIEKMLLFYDIMLEEPVIIHFIYSVKDYENVSCEKFEKWKCGFHKGNEIFVLSPSIIEKVGIHKKKEVKGIILHELSHVFFRLRGLETIPLFEEGLAEYFGQYKQRIKQKIDLEKEHLEDYLMGNKNIGKFYLVSFHVVKNILNKFGKEKLFMFLELLKKQKNKTFETFKNKFKEVFGVPF